MNLLIFPSPRSPITRSVTFSFLTVSHIADLGSPSSATVSAIIYDRKTNPQASSITFALVYALCKAGTRRDRRCNSLMIIAIRVCGLTPRLAQISFAFSKRADTNFLRFSLTESTKSGAEMNHHIHQHQLCAIILRVVGNVRTRL